MAKTGRDLPPAAARLAKAVANSTWGQFAMQGEGRGEVMWADEAGNERFATDLPNRNMPHQWAVHIAAEVTSRVRAQTLLEGLYGTIGTVIHTDTDGLIVPQCTEMPENSGSDFGQWQVKENMKVVEIRAPQFYRYQVEEKGIWHYVASGMTPAQAALTFDKFGHLRTRISFLNPTEMTLPPANAHDAETIARLLEEAKAIA